MNFNAPGRRLGLKLLLIGGIVFLLGVPLAFISFLTWERSERAEEVVSEVGAQSGGAQIVRGPFLVVPYSKTVRVWETVDGARVAREELRHEGYAVISAAELAYDVSQTVTQRRRAIYSVPVYEADVAATGHFLIPEIDTLEAEEVVPDWENAQLVVAISDLRAFRRPLELSLAGRPEALEFEPGSPLNLPTWRSVSVYLGAVRPGSELAFEMNMGLSGASALNLTASGRETRAALTSDWPHPGFFGGFLPETSTISGSGHEASWTVPYLARGVPAVFATGDSVITGLDRQAFGVRLVTPADGYQQVGRSLKYGLFFIGFLMLMLFLIEIRAGQRLHPAQYLMLGMAQVTFYLLLLALSEHAASATAFLLAGAATVGLSSVYSISAFASRRMGLVVLVAMSVVYAMQYLLILVEDYALLVGSLLAFGGLAAAMMLTRRVDWYDTAKP